MFLFCLQRDLGTEGTKKRRQSTEGEEEGAGERRPLKLARAHQETLRTGKVYTHTYISIKIIILHGDNNTMGGKVHTHIHKDNIA